jgi:hypothetical protein
MRCHWTEDYHNKSELVLLTPSCYNASVHEPLSAQESVCGLLAAAWDAGNLPAADSIPWPAVLRLAQLGNVGPVVYYLARRMGYSMPPDVHEALEQIYYRAAADNVRCLEQLAQLHQALSGAGSPLLLLKGAAFAETLYVGLAPRLIGDIDLAVPAERALACRAALLALGYVPMQAEHQAGTLLSHSNQEAFEPPPPYSAPFELHWHIVDVPYYLRTVPMSWFWDNTESALIGGRSFRVLNATANLVYLPAHLALHHGLRRLHSLFDLALLITRGRQLDWQQVIAAAHSFELISPLRSTLDLLFECWPSLPLTEPRRVLCSVEPTPNDERLFRLLTEESRNSTLDFYTTLVSLPSVAAKARYAWFNLFPQPKYMRARYGIRARWQLPYWYAHRLGGGLFRLVSALPRARRIDRRRR